MKAINTHIDRPAVITGLTGHCWPLVVDCWSIEVVDWLIKSQAY